MAYKKNYLDEDENQGGQAGAAGAGQILAGNSGSGPTPQQPAKGSGWTNLSTYLDMNQGQTGGLAQTYNNANQQVVDKAIGTDLVKSVQEDQKWSAPINQAKGVTEQIKSGDVSKVDANQFKTIQGSQYQKPQNYGQLGGYQDVLGNFTKAADRIDNINDYGTQNATLRNEFQKNYKGYNSGMGTLDTFLLRGDKDAQAQTAAFKEKNKDYGSTKNADGTKGNSVRFQNDVDGNLNNFFAGQESAFNAAKGDMLGAVGQRRSAIEAGVTPEMIAARNAELEAAAAQSAGVGLSDLAKFRKSSGTLDAADLLSDSDWNALMALEGLDGAKSSIQSQARGDYSVGYDSDAAKAAQDAARQRAIDNTMSQYTQIDQGFAERTAPKPKDRSIEEAAGTVAGYGADPLGTLIEKTTGVPLEEQAPWMPGSVAKKATKETIKVGKKIGKKLGF